MSEGSRAGDNRVTIGDVTKEPGRPAALEHSHRHVVQHCHSPLTVALGAHTDIQISEYTDTLTVFTEPDQWLQ